MENSAQLSGINLEVFFYRINENNRKILFLQSY